MGIRVQQNRIMLKSTRAVVQKVADTRTTFILQLSKILSSDNRASASKIEKMAKKLQKISILENFFKS
jgi:hypothetical protein